MSKDVEKVQRNWNPQMQLRRMGNGAATAESGSAVSPKLNSCDMTLTPLPRFIPKRITNIRPSNTCPQTFTELFRTAKRWKHPNVHQVKTG